MTVDPANTTASTGGLVDRVKNILLTPKAEWARIGPEPADVGKLYVGYALPLLALAAVCQFIGLSMVGLPFIGRLPMVLAAAQAVSSIVVGLISLFIVAFVANALAPSFGSKQDMGQAHKLSVYSATAGLVAQVLTIFPPLGILAGIGGLYSIVLLYFGLPSTMGTPTDKQVVYAVVMIIAYIVVVWVLFYITAMILGSLGLGMLGMAASAFSVPK